MGAFEDLQRLARFPKGKPVNVPNYLRDHGNPEAADKWEEMNDEYGDKFKEAGALEQLKALAKKGCNCGASGEDGVLSRFDEGESADPTENMSEEDAKKWRLQNLQHRDQFSDKKADPLVALQKLALDKIDWKGVAKRLLDRNKGMTQEDLHYRAYMRAVIQGQPSDHLVKKFKGAEKAREELIDFAGKGNRARYAAGWEPGHLDEQPPTTGPDAEKEEGSDVPDGEGNTAKRARSTRVAIDLWVAVKGDKLLGATDAEKGKDKGGWKNVNRAKGKFEILRATKVPNGLATKMVDWGANNEATNAWKDEGAAYKAISRHLSKGTDKKAMSDMDMSDKLQFVQTLLFAEGGLSLRQAMIDDDLIDELIDEGVVKLNGRFYVATPQTERWFKSHGGRSRKFATDLEADWFGHTAAKNDAAEVMERVIDKTLDLMNKSKLPADQINKQVGKFQAQAFKAVDTGSFKTWKDLSRVHSSELDKLEKKMERDIEKAMAKKAATGLYGYTKSLQTDVERANRKVAKVAKNIAMAAYRKHAKVTDFLGTHSERGASVPALILMAAYKDMGPKVAMGDKAETLQGIRDKRASDKSANDKAAANYGLYGYRAKVAKIGLQACTDLRSEVGRIASELHRRKAAKHAQVTGFLEQHSREANCLYSKVLHASYPSIDVKLASVPAPSTVDGWIQWED